MGGFRATNCLFWDIFVNGLILQPNRTFQAFYSHHSSNYICCLRNTNAMIRKLLYGYSYGLDLSVPFYSQMLLDRKVQDDLRSFGLF